MLNCRCETFWEISLYLGTRRSVGAQQGDSQDIRQASEYVTQEVDCSPRVEDLVYVQVDECSRHVRKSKVASHKEDGVNEDTFLRSKNERVFLKCAENVLCLTCKAQTVLLKL